MTTGRCSNFLHTFDRAAIFAPFAGVTNSAPAPTQNTFFSPTLLPTFCSYSSINTASIVSQLLGVFANLRKAAISFVITVCLSVCWSVRKEQLGSNRTGFREILCRSVSLKSVEEIKVSLISEKNNWYFTWGPIYVFDHISLSSFRMKYASDKSCRENQSTHFMSSNILSKVVPWIVLCRKTQYSQRVHEWRYGACTFHAGYKGYKLILTICNTSCFCTAKMVERTRLTVTLYVHCLSCKDFDLACWSFWEQSL